MIAGCVKPEIETTVRVLDGAAVVELVVEVVVVVVEVVVEVVVVGVVGGAFGMSK